LFDIVTQYRALFSDDDPLLSSSGSAPASNRLLFSSWIERKIEDFLNLLKTDLNRGAKKQSLDSIVGQVVKNFYFSKKVLFLFCKHVGILSVFLSLLVYFIA
jgi:hypothetical protein